VQQSSFNLRWSGRGDPHRIPRTVIERVTAKLVEKWGKR
jgi:hypothetical protein